MDDQQEPGSVTSAQTPESDAKSSAPEPGESDSGAKAGKPKKKKKSFARELLTIVVAAAVLTLLVKAFLVQVYRIPSASMENTLQIGDRVLVNKLVYHFRDIARGDVIVFSGQDSWGPDAPPPPSNPLVRGFDDVLSGLGLHSDQTYYIKRVIGLPGDRVACCDVHGRVTVNGVALNESQYLYPGEQPSAIKFNNVVPAWPPVGHGGPPRRLRGLALPPGGPGRRRHPGEPGRGPGVLHHLAAVAVPRPAHPLHLPAGLAARGRRGSGRARGRRDRAGGRGGRSGGRSGRDRRRHRDASPAAAPAQALPGAGSSRS